MIVFKANEKSGYRDRTIQNASADVTIAIALDFNSAGEKLTKKAVLEQGKLYFPIDLGHFGLNERALDVVSRLGLLIKDLNKSEITLNIAGNGLYTLRQTVIKNQSTCDYFTYCILKHLVNELDRHKENGLFDTKIVSVRTGGQSGFDEAGAKAAVKLGIPTLVHAPNDWVYRDIDGVDHYGEETFKKRFEK
jgi:hypothetical protein